MTVFVKRVLRPRYEDHSKVIDWVGSEVEARMAGSVTVRERMRTDSKRGTSVIDAASPPEEGAPGDATRRERREARVT